VQVTGERGVIIREETLTEETSVRPAQDIPALILTVVSVFLLYNIPTIILLVTYFACREKQRRKTALDKMRMQDLE
jgi:hypothetical protein